MKISHELPINALHLSKEINSYEYCLPHLMDESKEYRRYFYGAKSDGRYIIMDNSLHELGAAYDRSRLLHWVDEIEPDEFIVPDVWQDRTANLVSAKEWTNVELPDNTTKVAVIQANNIREASESYNILTTQGYDKIAFSYGASWYKKIVKLKFSNETLRGAYGRFIVINELYNSGIIESTHRVHLLGCQVPQEFGWYNNFPFIESLDTSNPVMAAIEGIRYKNYGLIDKPIANMNDSFDDLNEKLIIHNAKKFRKLNGFSPLSD